MPIKLLFMGYISSNLEQYKDFKRFMDETLENYITFGILGLRYIGEDEKAIKYLKKYSKESNNTLKLYSPETVEGKEDVLMNEYFELILFSDEDLLETETELKIVNKFSEKDAVTIET